MKEQVIELAKQAGFQKFLKPADRPEMICDPAALERFAALVRNAALEEAANTCVDLNNDEATSAHRYDKGTTERRAWNQSTTDCADAIRNLKEPTP